MKGLQDYTTEQLQKELDKRHLEQYSDYEIREEIKRRNKEILNRILSRNTELDDAFIKYNIDIDKITNIIPFYKETLVYIYTDNLSYILKRNINSNEYIMDSIRRIKIWR